MTASAPLAHKILNFILFQVGWFACILPAASGRPIVGPIAVTILVVAHVLLVRTLRRELILLSIVGVLGWLFDSLLVLVGVLDFPPQAQLLGPSTLWMAFMWINFGTTLNLSMAWLERRPILAAAFGAIGGPSAYFAGMAFGAVVFPTTTAICLAVIALEWAIATPLLVAINRRLNDAGPLRASSLSGAPSAGAAS